MVLTLDFIIGFVAASCIAGLFIYYHYKRRPASALKTHYVCSQCRSPSPAKLHNTPMSSVQSDTTTTAAEAHQAKTALESNQEIQTMEKSEQMTPAGPFRGKGTGKELFTGWVKVASKMGKWHARFILLSDDGWLVLYKDETMKANQCFGWVYLYDCTVEKDIKRKGLKETYRLNIENLDRKLLRRHGCDLNVPPTPLKRVAPFNSRKLRFKCESANQLHTLYNNLQNAIEGLTELPKSMLHSDDEEEEEEFESIVDYGKSMESPEPFIERKGSGSSEESIDEAQLLESIKGLELKKRTFTTPFLGPITELTAVKGDEETFSADNRRALMKYVSNFTSGIDLVNISLPVSLNEPISFLQRMCEQIAYNELLDAANNCEDSTERLMYVAAFAVSQYSSERTTKPFNPILGETFEHTMSNGSRFIAEQVSHHPPIGACFCENDNFKYWSDLGVKTKFGGNSVTAEENGTHSVYLKKYGDSMTWPGITTVIHNVLVGRMWIDHYGTTHIHNKTTGDYVEIEYKAAGWFGKERWEVNANIYDKEGSLRITLSGRRNSHLTATRIEGPPLKKTDIWSNDLLQYDLNNNWKLNKFVQSMNQIPPYLQEVLPDSDSRFRPDRLALERQNIKEAAADKRSLEEKQRQQTKELQAKGREWTPLYFDKHHEHSNRSHWLYRGGYWEEREKRVKELQSRLKKSDN